MKKTVWRVIVLLLCCVMLFGIAACNNNSGSTGGSTAGSGDTTGGGGSTGSGETNTGSGGNTGSGSSTGGGGTASSGRDTLNIAITADSGTLDPLYNVGWDLLNALRMIYEPLWEQHSQEDGLAYRFILAESFEITDPLTLLVHMKKDAYFMSGNKVTAEDVLFSLDKANNRSIGPFFRTLDLEKSRVLDEYTLEMVFTESAPDLAAGFASFYIFDRLSYNEETIAMTTIGSGPYKVADYVVQSHLYLEARDDYWGGKQDIIPKLNFVRLTEEAQRVNALITGDVDIALVPFQDITFIQDSVDEMEVDLFSADTTCCLHMNPTTTRNVFSQLGVDARRAIALAIDRQAIINVAYDGFANMSRFPLSAGTADAYPALFDLGIYGEGYNPTLAKELAVSSGLVNYKPLLINNGGPVQALISEIIQLNLSQIGVDIEVQTLDPGSWLTVAFDESAWDMAVDFTFGGTCAMGYRMWARMIGGYLTSPWPGSERFIEIIEGPPAITTISDQAVLDAYYMELTKIHTESIPWFILCDVLVPTAHHVDLRGWRPMRAGNIIYTDLSWG